MCRALLLSVMLPGCLPSSSAPLAEPSRLAQVIAPSQLDAFAGDFGFAGGDAERAEVKAAVERAVAEFPAIFRGKARSRLGKVTGVIETLRLFRDDEVFVFEEGPAKLRVSYDGKASPQPPLPGSDEPMEASLHWQDDNLVLTVRRPGGAREVRYRLSGDGKTLAVHYCFTSPRLPTPVVYNLTYQRAAGALSATSVAPKAR